MAKTEEGLPVVSEKALRVTAAEIRGRQSIDLLREIDKENKLVSQAIREFALRSVPESRRAVIEKDMAAIYMLIKIEGRLDQAENNKN